MKLVETDYTQEQKELLNYLENLGVILETVIFDLEESPTDIYKASKEVIKKGIGILAERFGLQFRLRAPDLNINDYFKFQIFPEVEPTGEKIDFKSFLGVGFDFATSTIKLFSYDSENKVIYHTVEKGFAKALVNPPHGLRIEKRGNFASEDYQASENDAYSAITKSYLSKILCCDSISDVQFLHIISWSDNWSNYFDDGKEWWGTFCWTIYDSRTNKITFITASSTD
ncbi:hypothetical protein DIU31_014475 [Mucilaginibacter rubeus]|uniref:Uncharacterized protein n=1 Tax=Mucilaginibacter rubeus TaxID=2027860 RepID=A0AAE6JFA9_9SPHI|nr:MULTISPECIES: hypothetical protein [Mucilaginibacter]QEM04659.1 hypothetical protein DIU31_014475 [Mucilaginibacter rubeus]QEM17253.1 hypothetical protein DIU38_014625 [Mucilaginibacter gossypii]QTE46238.1 hypothetical protein J3L19_13070 [Mucilaginibacter rubeus]QTE52835.1 hypothetical protein J3L21_13045 [Mucilaginibacter rubeus]QTE57922.1 hypothetical protein J3L23_04720 [Mucilaginibacter rubeus]